MNIRVWRTQSVTDRAAAQELWEVYEAAFEKSKTRAVQDQLCYTHTTFMAALADADYWKFIVYLDGTPVGFVFATNNLDKAAVAYVNPGFLRRVEPDACRENRFYYFTGIAIHPDHQGKHSLFYLLIEDITKFIDAEHGVVGFDSSSETGAIIADIIEQATLMAQKKNGLRTNHSEYECVGSQRYFIQRLSTRSDD